MGGRDRNSPILFTKGLNCSLPLRGRTEQEMGATTGGRDSHERCSSPFRTPKLCSKMAYMMRPMPNDGSITDGVTSTTARERRGG